MNNKINNSNRFLRLNQQIQTNKVNQNKEETHETSQINEQQNEVNSQNEFQEKDGELFDSMEYIAMRGRSSVNPRGSRNSDASNARSERPISMSRGRLITTDNNGKLGFMYMAVGEAEMSIIDILKSIDAHEAQLENLKEEIASLKYSLESLDENEFNEEDEVDSDCSTIAFNRNVTREEIQAQIDEAEKKLEETLEIIDILREEFSRFSSSEKQGKQEVDKAQQKDISPEEQQH